MHAVFGISGIYKQGSQWDPLHRRPLPYARPTQRVITSSTNCAAGD